MSDNLPPLPKELLDLIGEYGMARTDFGVGTPSHLKTYTDLIAGIKDYARAAIEADRVSRDMPADLAAVLLELDTPIAGLLGSHSGKFVPGTSKDSKEFDAFESAIPLVRWTDHERTCRKIAALAASPQPQPVCPTCSGHGMIGGPSFYAPDEGGVPCPDCNQPQPVQASEAEKFMDAAGLCRRCAAPVADAPIDMVLHCPACGMQHVDAPSPTDGQNLRMWSNPPHKSHLCRPEDGGCGHIWRPADVPTNGVAAIKTKGKVDSRQPAVPRPQPVQAQQFNFQRTPISWWGQQPIGMSTGQPSEKATSESQVLTFADVASRVCRAVAELPDRNSPEGWPDAMLVTQSELHGIMMAALDEWIDCIASMQAQKEE